MKSLTANGNTPNHHISTAFQFVQKNDDVIIIDIAGV
jgi:hypothetical protein